MRLLEFTNAAEQLGLLRRILDSTWQAIADEAAEQEEQRLAAAAAKPDKHHKASKPPTPPRPNPVMPRPAPATPQADEPEAKHKAEVKNTQQLNKPVAHAKQQPPKLTSPLQQQPFANQLPTQQQGVPTQLRANDAQPPNPALQPKPNIKAAPLTTWQRRFGVKR